MIAVERIRQLHEEGWTEGHDDTHTDGELAAAAVVYILLADLPPGPPTDLWPWEDYEYKPSEDPIVNLTKAGALIAAELDRRLRIKSAAGAD